MKKLQYQYILVFILAISFNSNAQEKISLDEDWRFHFGNSADPSKAE